MHTLGGARKGGFAARPDGFEVAKHGVEVLRRSTVFAINTLLSTHKIGPYAARDTFLPNG